MKKKFNKGYMLVETLLVTSFVCGVMIFLYIQYTSIIGKIDKTEKYNNVESIYLLNNVKNHFQANPTLLGEIISTINDDKYIDLSICKSYDWMCKKIYEYSNINKVIAIKGDDISIFSKYKLLKQYINVKSFNKEKYYIVAIFKNKTVASIELEV